MGSDFKILRDDMFVPPGRGLNGKCLPAFCLSRQHLWLLWQEDVLEADREDEGEQNQGGQETG